MLAAIVRRVGPAELPFHVLLFGDFAAMQLRLAELPLLEETLQDQSVEAYANTLFGFFTES